MAPSNGEYHLTDALPNADIDSLEAGTNLLILGSGHDEMRSIVKDLLTAAPEYNEGSVLLSLDGEVEWLVEHFADSEAGVSSLSIIEGTGEPMSADGLEPEQLFSVDSPESLTELGMALIEYEDTCGASFDGNRIVFDSISELLAHVDEQRAFEFLAAFSGRIRVAEDFGIWLMHSQEHSQETVFTFRELFDIVVELPGSDDLTEVEVNESAGDTGEWVSRSNA